MIAEDPKPGGAQVISDNHSGVDESKPHFLLRLGPQETGKKKPSLTTEPITSELRSSGILGALRTHLLLPNQGKSRTQEARARKLQHRDQRLAEPCDHAERVM